MGYVKVSQFGTKPQLHCSRPGMELRLMSGGPAQGM